MDAPLPEKPADDAPATEETAYEAHKERSQDVACLMLLSMIPKLKIPIEDMDAYNIIIQLKAMMMRLFENLESLGVRLGNKLATDIILYTLHKGYANFVVNYHMNSLDKTVHELLGMLKTAEKSIKSEPKKNILMVQKKKNAFKKGDNKNKKKASGKQDTGKTVTKFVKLKNGPSLDQKCFYCNQRGIGRGMAQRTKQD
ncbi:UNVERIFIED_CONTAM: hypothetical protein Sangu_2454800 [Sesamum angustifolium]|uniref:Uncharacterized protein n=1 Tax=Sesamum angustifolium TaxID=2727405 RepID=A0AAW2KZM8_9LAMI